MVKRVNGRGRPRKVAHDQLRRAPQPGDQGAVSAQPPDDEQPGTSRPTITSPQEADGLQPSTAQDAHV